MTTEVVENSALPQSTRRTPWKLIAWAVLWCFLAYLGSLIVSIGFLFATNFLGYDLSNDINVAATELIVSGSILFSILGWVAVSKAKKAGNGDLRLGLGFLPIQHPRMVAGILVGLLVYGFALTLCVSIFPGINPYPDLARHIREVNPVFLLPAALLTGVVAPLVEEAFFRGWLWAALRRHWGVLATATATGLLWYLLHAGHGLLYMVLLLPTIFAISAVRYVGGSLQASILVHVAYNIFCVAAWLVLAFVMKL